MKSWLKSISAVILIAIGTTTHGAIIFDGGSPNLVEGHEVTQFVVADDFQLAQGGSVSDAHFWTLEGPTASWDRTLRWFIFNDNSGMPAASPSFMGDGTNVQKMATGRNGNPPFGSEFEYRFDLDTPVSTLKANVTYWFGLHLSVDFFLDSIFWETTTGTGLDPTSNSAQFGDFNNWTNTGLHMAFNLTSPLTRTPTVSEPISLALLGLGLAGIAFSRRPTNS